MASKRLVWLPLAFACAGVLGLGSSAMVSAQEALEGENIPFVQADAAKAVNALATALEDDFVFPEVGKSYARMLRANLAAGAYERFPNAGAFAAKLNSDLQSVHPDRHLGVRAIVPGQRAYSPEEASLTAVGKSGWLPNGIAYVQLRRFTGSDESVAAVRNFLQNHKNAKTLILDARLKGGGGLAEINLIFSQIFAKPTTLVDVDFRRAVEAEWGPPFGGGPTFRLIAGPSDVVRREHFVTPAADQGRLKTAKVFVLVSHDTFSATEHLAFALKRTKRAILVGESTAGGAHFGGSVPLEKNYAVFIPFGRTFDPDTGQDWEGVGVKPDVEVPAERALEKVLAMAGVRLSEARALASLR